MANNAQSRPLAGFANLRPINRRGEIATAGLPQNIAADLMMISRAQRPLAPIRIGEHCFAFFTVVNSDHKAALDQIGRANDEIISAQTNLGDLTLDEID